MGDFIYEEQGYILDLPMNQTNMTNTTTTRIKNRYDIMIVSICIIMFIYLSSVYTLLIQKPHNATNGDIEMRRATRMGRDINNEVANQIVFEYNGEDENHVSITINQLDRNHICKDYILQENEECIICKEEFEKNDKMKQLKCEHHFCEQCIRKWFNNNNTCPNCRTHIY